MTRLAGRWSLVIGRCSLVAAFDLSNASAFSELDSFDHSFPFKIELGCVYLLSIFPGTLFVGSFSSATLVALSIYRITVPMQTRETMRIVSSFTSYGTRDVVTSLDSESCSFSGYTSGSTGTLWESHVVRVIFVLLYSCLCGRISIDVIYALRMNNCTTGYGFVRRLFFLRTRCVR